MKKETKNTLRIAIVQQNIEWGNPPANRTRIKTLLEQSAAVIENADLFVLPETFTTGFGKHMASLAEPADGPTLDFARETALKHNVLFCSSWIVREGAENYNRFHFVSPNGEVWHYDKAHTFRVSGESEQIVRGKERTTIEWRGWRIRPAVCYDLRFPTWLRNGPEFDYDLLLVCANWPASRSAAWKTLLKARAIENLSYVVGCNRVGVDGEGGLYTGNSMAVDFKGLSVNGEDFTSEGVATIEIDAKKLENFRSKWPFNLDFDNADTLWRKN